MLTSLKLLLLNGISKNNCFNFYDVSTAFLHADLQEEVYGKPPVEFYSGGGPVWKLRKAMHGLKTAPKVW